MGASTGLQMVDIAALSIVVLHWTAVLTVAIAAFIVTVMKGPAYVADAYRVEDSEPPIVPIAASRLRAEELLAKCSALRSDQMETEAACSTMSESNATQAPQPFPADAGQNCPAGCSGQRRCR